MISDIFCNLGERHPNYWFKDLSDGREIFFIDSLSMESQTNSGRPKDTGPYSHIWIGSFFKVTLPQKFGEVHLLRLMITNFLEGGIKNHEWFCLVASELIERIINKALRDRNFRLKWKKYKLFDIIKRISKNCIPKIYKQNCSLTRARYYLINQIEQEQNLSRFIIPPHRRDDNPLTLIKVHLKKVATLPKKKVSKRVSLAAMSKGNLPDSVSLSWKEVCNSEYLLENGKVVKPRIIQKPDPGSIENV